MKRFLIALGCLSVGVAHAGSARLTAEIVAEHERSVQQWMRKLSMATPEEQAKLWPMRPDGDEFGARVWSQLRTSLSEEWMLSYAPVFFEEAPNFVLKERQGKVPSRELLRAVERFHMKSPQVGRLCISLTAFRDPSALNLMQRIAEINPDPKVQGQASLAQALLLKHIGDDAGNMKKRLQFLREAIIKSAEVKVGKTTVGAIAESELYAIQYLSKGREAPNLVGRDVAGKAVSLQAYRGKVTVLVFWQAVMQDAERMMDLLRKFHQQHQGRPVELLGVAVMQESLLRTLRGNGTVPWRNILDANGALAGQYQVLNMPKVYVIDQKGVIQHIGSPGSFVDLTVEALLSAGKDGR